MTNYYNDHDRHCCAWIRRLIANGEIPPGDVDDRPIQEVKPNDLKGYTQIHTFCGIAGWPLALKRAGFPASRPVFTASAPCPAFSVAGRKKYCQRCQSPHLIAHPLRTGFFVCADCEHEWLEDDRHLWPEVLRLVEALRPPVCFGEQVSGQDALWWLAGVRCGMEGIDYRFDAVDINSAGFGASHIRQRLFWGAYAECHAPQSRGASIESRNGTKKKGTGASIQSGRLRPDVQPDADANRLELSREPPAGEQRQHEPDGGNVFAGPDAPIRKLGGDQSGTLPVDRRWKMRGSTDGEARSILSGSNGEREPIFGSQHAASDGRVELGAESGGGRAAGGCGDDDAGGDPSGTGEKTAQQPGCGNELERPSGIYGTDRNAFFPRLEGHAGDGDEGNQPGRFGAAPNRSTRAASPWDDYWVALCRDIDKRTGEQARRRVGSGIQPLAPGVPRLVGPLLARLGQLRVDPAIAKRIVALARANRVCRLRGYGNAICIEPATQFIIAYCEENGIALERQP